jgi:hypothetical protein
VNVNVVRIFQFWRVFFISLSLSLSLFIGSRCGYSLDPGRFERKTKFTNETAALCVCYGSCFVASVRHYIFIEIESLLLLSSLDVVAVGQVGISSTFFFFFSFLFSLFSHSLLLSSFKPRRRSRFLFYAEAQTLFSCSPFPRESSLHSKSS